uniref:Putative mitochondrial protein n=1 Tax=Noccaea caerulescens TaxID=107243 RepID=A0A1J3EE23_NOCCA
MATKAEEDLDPLNEGSDELVSMKVAPKIHGSATQPAKRGRSIKRKHRRARSRKAKSRSRSHSSKAVSGVVSSLPVDGKRFRSLSPLVEFQNLPQDRLCSCVASVLTLTNRAGIEGKQRFESGRANRVWKPGELLGVNVQLIWFERFHSVDARILQTVKTSSPWATDFKDWRRMMGVDNGDWSWVSDSECTRKRRMDLSLISLRETCDLELNQELLKMGSQWVLMEKQIFTSMRTRAKRTLGQKRFWRTSIWNVSCGQRCTTSIWS